MTRLLILLLLKATVGIAQQEATNWYFGEKAGLVFGGGAPIPVFNSAMTTPEGSASLSDKDGNLLFYTNGNAIWNRRHQLMDNGFSLNGSTSSTQSSIIIPHPGADSLYYVFAVDNHAGPKGVTYSIVNIRANGGLGKVVTKNIVLAQNTSEKITAVHSCNNRDVWLVIRMWQSSSFYSFLIDRTGLNPDPVISNSPNTLIGHEWGTLGSMKISPNGIKLAAAHAWSINKIELGDFDRATGEVRNIGNLDVSPPAYNGFNTGPYGLEFSANNRFLYVYSAYNGTISSIHQFDLALPTLAQIQASRQLITEINYPYAGSMQLGPDQKIYITNSFDSSLSVIEQPDLPGAACRFRFAAVSLGRRCGLGLPNFIQSFADPDYSAADFNASNCSSGTLDFSINRPAAINAVKWDFGDPASGAANSSTSFSPTHRYSASGFYTVSLIAYRSCSIDTVRKKIYSGNLSLTLNDRYDACDRDSLRLQTTFYQGVQYLWSNGDLNNFTDVTTPGKYILTVKAGCSFTDSTEVFYYNRPVLDLGADKTICTGDQVILDAGIDNVQYLWNTGDNGRQLNVNRVGLYWVRVTNIGNSCFRTDTIKVGDKPFPAFSLGKDTVICETEELVLKTRLAANPALEFLWQDGTRKNDYPVSGPGVYWVRVSNGCTVKTDSIAVVYKVCPLGIPNAFTPNGDGKNDRFRPKYGEGIGDYRFRVYNRFGQLIFESANQLSGWDGTWAGRPQPPGTYAWTLQYSDMGSGKQVRLKGTVNLVR